MWALPGAGADLPAFAETRATQGRSDGRPAERLFWTLPGSTAQATLEALQQSVRLASGLFGGVIAVYSMFNAMRLLPAATVYVLNGLTPLFTALGGALLLGEYVNGPMWLGIGVTSAGVAAFQLATYRAKGGRNPAGSGAA